MLTLVGVVLLAVVPFSSSTGGMQVGGETKIDQEKIFKGEYSDLLGFVDEAVAEENDKMNSIFRYVWLPESIEASSQVVQGVLYHVHVDIAPSTCRKSKEDRLKVRVDYCTVDEELSSELTQHCEFEIWSRVWMKAPDKLKITAKCMAQ